MFDIETNGLLPELDTVHVIAAIDLKTGEEFRWDKGECAEGAYWLEKQSEKGRVLAGHNIVSFDIPALHKVYGFSPPGDALDTLILARCAYPDVDKYDWNLHRQGKMNRKYIGRHGLEAWGVRLGIRKDDFKGPWDVWTQEMSDYCAQDVRVNAKLLEALLKKEVPSNVIELEQKVRRIVDRQTAYGFLFDHDKAVELYATLVEKRKELEWELISLFPPRYVADGKVFTPKRSNRTLGYVKGCKVQKIKLKEFSPGSSQDIAHWFKKKYRWVPTEFTDTGLPAVTEEVLADLEYPEARKLAEFAMVQKRISALAEGKQAWMKKVGDDGRIHGEVNTLGAVSARMTHSNPNLAQVPSIKNAKGVVPYGAECRDLFIVPEGRVLVGADASGIELRCLGHYLSRFDNGAFVKELLSGDVHVANQNAIGLDTRDKAKRWIYALIYGAGDAKLGNITLEGRGDEDAQRKLGRKQRARYMKNMPAFEKLTSAIKRRVKETKGIYAIDGRFLPSRSEHSALNLLLQSCAAIVMKVALVRLDESLQKRGYVAGADYEFVVNCHDEVEIETLPELGDIIGETAIEAIKQAGEHFNFRCPLDGEYKIGRSWKETH